MIKKKLFIFSFISSIIAFVFCLFSVNSYAYQTNNNFTNTLTYFRSNANNYTTDLNMESFTISNTSIWYRIGIGSNITDDYAILVNLDYSNVSDVNISNVRFNYNGSTTSFSTYRFVYPSGKSNLTMILNPVEVNATYCYLRFDTANVVVKNIDIVLRDNIYLSYYYDTYITNLNNQIANLESDYQTLTNQYTTLEGQYSTLENDYQNLQNSYNTLENDYQGLTINTNPFLFNNVYSYSITLNSYDITSTNNNNSNIPTYYFTFNNNSISLNAYDMFIDSDVEPYWDTSSNNYINIDINLLNYSTYNIFTTNEFDFSEFYNESLLVKFYRDNILVNSFVMTDTSTIEDNIYSFNVDINQPYNKIVLEFDLKPIIEQNTKYIIYNQNGYNIGYSNGYKDGYNLGYVNGEEYANQTMQNTIGVNAYNDGYADGYAVYTNYLDNGTSYETILISLATGPINIFKQIFNFEVLGANLSVLITSVITLLITIWVIKRFLR